MCSVYPVFSVTGRDGRTGSSSVGFRGKTIIRRRRTEEKPTVSESVLAGRWRPAHWSWWWTAASIISCWSRWTALGPAVEGSPQCLYWDMDWGFDSPCFVFRMSGSFTNRSSVAMLRTGDPLIQCRLVSTDWPETVETDLSDVWPLLLLLQFYLTSLGGQLKQSMDDKDKGWVNWKVSITLND